MITDNSTPASAAAVAGLSVDAAVSPMAPAKEQQMTNW
jgi:hypothetical protein